jgi:hypothetical protein
MFLELDEKPQFKEASYTIRFATSSLAWNFNKRLNPISLDRLSTLSFFVISGL